jgi:hypothetical protein
MRRTDSRLDFARVAGAVSLGARHTSGWDATQSADRLGPERWLVEVAGDDAADDRTEVSTGGGE